MNIPWKLKTIAFRAAESLNAMALLYWLYTSVTRPSRKNLSGGGVNQLITREHLISFGRPTLFDFSAGWSLQQNLCLRSFVSAYTNASIGRLNFLQFSESEFARHNHSVHYRNRLRHLDYLALFHQVGFEAQKAMSLKHMQPPTRIDPQFNPGDRDTFAKKGIFLCATLEQRRP